MVVGRVRDFERYHWGRERADQHIIGPVSRAGWFKDGIGVYAADWDQLLVLDACRADLFEEVADLGEFDAYGRQWSRGSATCEWTERNWQRDASDVEYYTANVVVSQHIRSPGDFAAFNSAYRMSETETMHADQLVDTVRDADPDVDNHRIVVHAVEPHAPFHAAGWFDHSHTTPWRALRAGERTKNEVWEAYKRNLEHGLDALLPLAREWPGRTVVTADHGNLLGERVAGLRTYGHPRGVRHPNLVHVPWAVVDSDAPEQDQTAATSVADQLEALGYA